jgi:F0F1-type ATP synthase assembly protein I
VQRESPSLGTLLGIGITTAGVLAAGLALGWLVDALLGTIPIFIFVGLVLGIVGAVSYVVIQFRTYLKP